VTILKKTPGISRGFYINKLLLINYFFFGAAAGLAAGFAAGLAAGLAAGAGFPFPCTFAIASLSSVLIPVALSLAALTLLLASM
jgi:hypothetical protein